MFFDLSEKEEMSFFAAIGATIIFWGIAESCTAQACHMLFKAGGHKSQRLPPREMGRRLNYIRLCFRDYPELRHMRDFCNSLIADTRKVLPHREYIVHGLVVNFDRAKLSVKFARLDAKVDQYEQTATDLTIQQLFELSAAANKIGHDWIKLVEGMHRVRDVENGLKHTNRVWHIAIRERAYGVYKRIKGLVGLR